MPFNPAIVADGIQAGVAFASVTPASKLPDAWEVTSAGGSLAPPSGFVPQPTAFQPFQPRISWPGAVSCVNLNYLNSHGISPGIAVLTLNPQDQPPEVFGNLAFGDSLRPPIILHDCHMDSLEVSISSAGAYVICQIADRRWRWQQGYPISGEYNRLDEHGNFIPWTVRSAKELAEICLKAMGEKRYTLAFPPGLKSTQADKYERYLRAGERFPLTYANPYMIWDNIPAALALQQLADQFGCRVMYDPISDRVAVLPVGYGGLLPYGGTSVATASQGITAARLPKYLEVQGANIKFQMRLKLEAVGEEYDGLYTKINDLTYAPIIKASTSTQPAVTGWDYSAPPTFANVTPTERLEYTEAVDFAQRSIYRAYRIATGKADGSVSNSIHTTAHGFTKVISGQDVDGSFGIKVPGLNDAIVTGDSKGVGRLFGVLPRRHYVIMTPAKVDQVKPRPRRDTDIVVEPNRPNISNDPGSLPDYYNGYSRDRPAECFGTFHHSCVETKYVFNAGIDIVIKRRVYISFTFNSYEQLVVFNDPIWSMQPHTATIFGIRKYIEAEDLFVETGVYVINPDTNYPYRCKYRLDLGGNAPGISETHDDIITHIAGIYDDKTNRLVNYRVDDFGDGKARANYYLAGMKRRFQNWQSQNVTYNGCVLVPPSGAVRQIQWQVGLGGISTSVGVNTEFSTNVPPYPVRKLQENLTPDAWAKMLNRFSSPYSTPSAADYAGKGPRKAGTVP